MDKLRLAIMKLSNNRSVLPLDVLGCMKVSTCVPRLNDLHTFITDLSKNITIFLPGYHQKRNLIYKIIL